MTALGKFIRTTTFKLTIVYLTVFSLFAAFLLGYFAWNTRRLFTEQINATVDAEVNGLTEQYHSGGIRRLVQVIESRSAQPGSSLYLVTTAAGEGLAGNVGYLPTGTLEKPGWLETEYRRHDDPASSHHALVRVFQLPGGFRMLVGRDLDDREKVLQHRHRRWPLVARAGGGARAGWRVLRDAARVAARRCHDRDHPHDRGRRSQRAAVRRRHRRRVRPAGGKPQRHAGAHRSA